MSILAPFINLDSKNHDGVSAVGLAIEFGHNDILKLLLQNGANPSLLQTNNNKLKSPLNLALIYNNSDALRELFIAGANYRDTQVVQKVAHTKGVNYAMVIFQAVGHHIEDLSPFVHSGDNYPWDDYEWIIKVLANIDYKFTTEDKEMISDRYKNTFHWLSDFLKQPQSLAGCCRICIRNSLHNNVLYSVTKLNIPKQLQNIILLSDLAYDSPYSSGHGLLYSLST